MELEVVISITTGSFTENKNQLTASRSMKKWKLDLNINLDLNTRLELNTHMDPNTHLNLYNHLKEAWEGHEDLLLPSVSTKKENVVVAVRRTLF